MIMGWIHLLRSLHSSRREWRSSIRTMWTLFWIVSGLWNFSRGEWRACGEELPHAHRAQTTTTILSIFQRCWVYPFLEGARHAQDQMAHFVLNRCHALVEGNGLHCRMSGAGGGVDGHPFG